MSRAQTVIVTLAVLAVLAAGGYLGWTALKPESHRTYPQAVRDDWTVECAALSHGADTDSVCRCALVRLERTYTLSQFTQFVQENAGTGVASPVIVDALEHCGGTYTPPTDPTTVTSVDHSLELPPGDFRNG